MRAHTSSSADSLDDTYDRALRGLDPAPKTLSARELARANDTLSAVMSSESADLDGLRNSPPTPTRGLPSWRWIAVPAVAATAIGAVVIGGMGSDSTAYAGWSATPTPLDPDDATLAGQRCHDMLSGMIEPEDGGPTTDAMESLEPQVNESRGRWTFTLMTSGDTVQGACFMPLELIGDAFTEAEQPNTFGGIATTNDPLELQGDEIETFFGGMGSTDEGLFGYLTGRVGDDVEAVRISTPGQRIDASVTNGHWAAWWPAGSQDRDDPEILNTTLQVILKDGTVLDR